MQFQAELYPSRRPTKVRLVALHPGGAKQVIWEWADDLGVLKLGAGILAELFPRPLKVKAGHVVDKPAASPAPRRPKIPRGALPKPRGQVIDVKAKRVD